MAFRQLKTVSKAFQRKLRVSGRIASDGYRLAIPPAGGGAPTISAQIGDFMTELAFFRAFLAWEEFLEDSFGLYLIGQRAPRGPAPIRYAFPPNRQVAAEWVVPEGLFAKLSATVSPSNLEMLRAMLCRRDIAIAELRRVHLDGKNDLKTTLARINAATERDIENRFGEKLAITVKEYENTLAQRQLVDNANRTLIYKMDPLNVTQVEMMIMLIKEKSVPPLALNASLTQVDAYVKAREDANLEIAAAASRFLSPVQLAVFRTEFDIELAYLRYFKMRRSETMASVKPGRSDGVLSAGGASP